MNHNSFINIFSFIFSVIDYKLFEGACVFVVGQRRSLVLSHDNYKYVKNRVSKDGTKVYWICAKKVSFNLTTQSFSILQIFKSTYLIVPRQLIPFNFNFNRELITAMLAQLHLVLMVYKSWFNSLGFTITSVVVKRQEQSKSKKMN